MHKPLQEFSNLSVDNYRWIFVCW